MKKQILTGIMAAAICTGAFAAEVSQNDYNAAQSGQPATAASINANFNALISAINDNAQRIETLEQAVAGSAAGTYKVIELGIILGANPGTGLDDGYSEIGTSLSIDGVVTLSEDGTFGDNSGTEVNSKLVDTILCGTRDGQEVCRTAYNPEFNVTENIDPSTGTWSETNNEVTLTFNRPDGTTSTRTARKAGPRLLLLPFKNTESSAEYEYDSTTLILLIKQ